MLPPANTLLPICLPGSTIESKASYREAKKLRFPWLSLSNLDLVDCASRDFRRLTSRSRKILYSKLVGKLYGSIQEANSSVCLSGGATGPHPHWGSVKGATSTAWPTTSLGFCLHAGRESREELRGRGMPSFQAATNAATLEKGAFNDTLLWR